MYKLPKVTEVVVAQLGFWSKAGAPLGQWVLET